MFMKDQTQPETDYKIMTTKLVECIANYSEARRPEVLEQIIESITSVAGATLLDQHSDMDHNRTVLTFVGAPEAVEEAAYRSIAKAAELIDLDQHSGEHPRIGATDVVPFVPISGVTMYDCVQMAQRLGQRVADELDIPVYLYEEAATIPERRNLENIRRGEYEGLKQELGIKPERQPDFGPNKVGKAGATVIGARQPLVAFNVYLTTGDINIANKIAKAVRHSTGGLRFVKALGMDVEGLAQVSMNLTNYQRTPVYRVVEMIRREAERYGVSIHHSELVGLIPQEALIDAAQWYMQLDQFTPDQVLENRLAATREVSSDPAPVSEQHSFLDKLASGEPTPGGGSAAAYCGAAGAALVAMVARLTIGKQKYTDVEEQMRSMLGDAETLRNKFTVAIQKDSEAFNSVMIAYRLAKDSDEQKMNRSIAIQDALLHAAQVPLEVSGLAVEVIEVALQAVKFGNLNAISDGATGAALARAALDGAGYNVRVNVSSLKDSQVADALLQELTTLEKRAGALEADIKTMLIERGGMSLA